MIEYNFNDLDNDFITLWSNYLLYDDTSSIMAPLKELAELGQINAIQCWYLLKKEDETSEKIENRVAEFYGDSFNEALAIANRMYDKNKPLYIALKKEIISNHEMGVEYGKKCYYEYNQVIDEQNNKYFIKQDQLIKQYRNTEYAKQLIKTADIAEHTAKTSNLGFFWQRLFEIYRANPMIFDNERIIEDDIKTLRKCFKKRIKNNPQDIPAVYSLGKNLIFFNEKPRYVIEGIETLRGLAERPLICCKTAIGEVKNTESQESES